MKHNLHGKAGNEEEEFVDNNRDPYHKIFVKVNQVVLRHNLTPLQRYYTLCQKLLWFISPEVLRVFVITV